MGKNWGVGEAIYKSELRDIITKIMDKQILECKEMGFCIDKIMQFFRVSNDFILDNDRNELYRDIFIDVAYAKYLDMLKEYIENNYEFSDDVISDLLSIKRKSLYEVNEVEFWEETTKPIKDVWNRLLNDYETYIKEDVEVSIKVPNGLAKYVESANTGDIAMLLYRYIKEGEFSHGWLSNMLDMNRLDLITHYGNYGIPYFDINEEDLNKDIETLKKCLKEDKEEGFCDD